MLAGRMATIKTNQSRPRLTLREATTAAMIAPPYDTRNGQIRSLNIFLIEGPTTATKAIATKTAATAGCSFTTGRLRIASNTDLDSLFAAGRGLSSAVCAAREATVCDARCSEPGDAIAVCAAPIINNARKDKTTAMLRIGFASKRCLPSFVRIFILKPAIAGLFDLD